MKTKFRVNPIRTAIVGAALMAANGAAVAAPVSASLEMVCPFPLIGDQTIIAQISADYPDELVLESGSATLGPINIDTITVVPDKARQGLAFVDATTVTGTATSINTFRTVVGDISNDTDLTIEPTTIPAGESGPFDVPAKGVAPAVTFDESHIGEVSLTVDDLILDMTNLRADGSTAPAPVGQFVSDCEVVAGQDTTLHTFEVVGDVVVEDPADIAVDTSALNFGSMQLGQTATRTVTITNAGDLALGINSVSIAGADASAFTETNSCTSIAGGSTCTVEVTYTASEEGTQNAALVIASTDADQPSVSIAMSGTGQVELKPEIEVAQTTVDFGTITAGESKTETITIENTGGAALTVSGVAIAGAEFFGSNDCGTVAPGSSCDVDVTYTATVGASTGSVTIASDDEDEASTTVSLSGFGEEVVVDPCVVDPDSCNGGGFEIEVPLAVNGSSYIAANHGTIPLKGDIAALIDLGTGAFTGDMQLEPTQGTFEIISGWSRYTATAQIEFEPVGITEGSLVDGKLVAVSQAYVKLPKVTKTMFGLINWKIGGGDNCRTKEPVTFTVSSAEGEPFDALLGGRVVGSYDLPKLENCGALTSILSLKMSGAGNTIDLTMTPMVD